MSDFNINVIVNPAKATSGMDKVDSRLKKTERAATRLQGTLTRAFTLVGILATVTQLGQLVDSVTNAQNRIRLVTKDTAQLNAVMSELFDISKRTRTGFDATATIFSRTALSVKNLGLSQRETLQFTESLNQAIVLSGVKAQEANAGLIQLSQGLASGTLRGDELRSVLEQLPKVADVIAQEMGVTRGELRLLGQEGKISAENVIDAFKSAADELRIAFASSVPTISQAFSVLISETTRFVGAVNSATGISTSLAKGLIFLAENLETIAKGAIVAGAALAGPFAKAGVMFATRAVLALGVAIAANPIGALIIGVSAAIAAIYQFGDSIKFGEDRIISLRDYMEATFQFVIDSMQPVVDTLTSGFSTAVNFITNALGLVNLTFSDILDFAKTTVNNIIGFYVGMGRAIVSVFNDLSAIIKSVVGKELLDSLSKNVTKVLNYIMKGLQVIKTFAVGILRDLGVITSSLGDSIAGLDTSQFDASFTGNMAKVGINAKNAFMSGFETDFVGQLEALVAPAVKQIEDNARKIATTKLPNKVTPDGNLDEKGVRSAKLPFALKEQIRLLEEETKILQLNSKERNVQTELLKLEEKLRSSNTTLTDSQRALLEETLRTTIAYREQADVLESIQQPYNDITTRQSALNDLYDAGKISLEKMNDQMLLLAIAQAELNIQQGEGSFQDGFVVGITNMLEAVRNFEAEAGETFGNFFEQATEGFANATADAIIFGNSFKDAIGSVAREALAGLLSGLIKIGLQYVLNAALGETLAAGMAASSVAQAATIATSWAPAASLVSLASFGANAAPAAAGMTATAALGTALAVIPGFMDGGYVSGPGGPRSDSIAAMLSDGEFVVNAKSTARFRPQLEAMNNSTASTGAASAPLNGQGSAKSEPNSSSTGGNSTRIINVLDPTLVGDFLTSSAGERVLVNVIERNSGSINQLLRNS